MTIDQILSSLDCDLSSPIDLCHRGEFRWGQVQAILYDPRRADIFVQPFLYGLYERTRLSGQRHPQPLNLTNHTGLGLLPTLFCGMTNFGPDAICSYLAQRAVCVVGEWSGEEEDLVASVSDGPDPQVTFSTPAPTPRFVPIAYCFPSTPVITAPPSLTGIPSNSVFAGYTVFSDYWRTPQQQVAMYLGLAWLFHTFSLAAIQGSRRTDNHLTRRLTKQFGFEDRGTMPYSMSGDPGGPLVDGIFSVLLRTEFERRLRAVFEGVRKVDEGVRLTVAAARGEEPAGEEPAEELAAESPSGLPASLLP